MKTLAAFSVLVACLALANWYSNHHDILNQPKYAPNIVMKVKNVTVKADDSIDPRTNPYLENQIAVFGRTLRPCPPCKGEIVINKRTSLSGEGVFIR